MKFPFSSPVSDMRYLYQRNRNLRIQRNVLVASSSMLFWCAFLESLERITFLINPSAPNTTGTIWRSLSASFHLSVARISLVFRISFVLITWHCYINSADFWLLSTNTISGRLASIYSFVWMWFHMILTFLFFKIFLRNPHPFWKGLSQINNKQTIFL